MCTTYQHYISVAIRYGGGAALMGNTCPHPPKNGVGLPGQGCLLGLPRINSFMCFTSSSLARSLASCSRRHDACCVSYLLLFRHRMINGRISTRTKWCRWGGGDGIRCIPHLWNGFQHNCLSHAFRYGRIYIVRPFHTIVRSAITPCSPYIHKP